MKIVQEFKDFAVTGNAMDLAVGVVIGAAFGKIVTSLVEDIIMPPLSMLTGKVDFSNLFVALNGQSYTTLKAAKDAGAPVLAYGMFANNIVNFLIMAFAIFMVIKQINRLHKEKPSTTKPCTYCKSDIAVEATRCPNCTSQLDGTPA
jgi:large conductance mechanosensitive channel